MKYSAQPLIHNNKDSRNTHIMQEKSKTKLWRRQSQMEAQVKLHLFFNLICSVNTCTLRRCLYLGRLKLDTHWTSHLVAVTVFSSNMQRLPDAFLRIHVRSTRRLPLLMVRSS